MGVKYTIPYKDHSDVSWRVDVSHQSYIGEPLALRTARDQGCIITYNNNGDDPYEPVVNSKASITVITYDGGVLDIEELQEAQDRDFRVQVYRNEVLYWQGFLIPDGIQGKVGGLPFTVQINATDGVNLLEGIDFTGTNNWPMPSGMATRCPLAYIREIFSYRHLDCLLPIRWINTLECLEYPAEDSFAGTMTWSIRGEGFTDFNGNYKSCYYILEGLLRSHQMRIYQRDGKWILERINDVVTGSYTWREISAVFDSVNVPAVTTGTVNETKEIGSDYMPIEDKPIIFVKPGLKGVKTTYKHDQRENILPNGSQDLSALNFPLYWATDAGFFQSSLSLTGRDGNSTELNMTGESAYGRFTLNADSSIQRLPIDTAVLYKSCRFSFIYSIATAPVNVDGDIEKVEGLWPVMFSLTMRMGSDTYTLSPFGSWVLSTGETYLLSANPRDILTKLDDISSVEYNSGASASRILLPQFPSDPAKDDICDIRVTIYVMQGCKAVVDQISLQVDENEDVYESSVTASKYTDTEEVDMRISSSFNGFFVSNLMTAWYNSHKEFEYTDGRSTGSLTKINSESIMRFRYASSKIIEGVMYGSDFKYGESYTVQGMEGIRFMPLRCEYNTESCQTRMTLIECRDDAVALNTKHYGSNDNLLSNY